MLGDISRIPGYYFAAPKETCRNWSLGLGNYRCGAHADVIVWGKLIQADALGPRCYPCVEKQLGYRAAHDPSYAIYHFRPLPNKR